MKKILAILLALTLLSCGALFCACGESPEPTRADTEETAAPPETQSAAG